MYGDLLFKKYIIFSIFLILSILISFSFPTKELYFPIKSYYVLTSKYGYRNLGTYHFHSGIDLGCVEGSKIYALSSGTVIYAGYYSSCGHSIIISYDNGYKSLYGHVSPKYIVKVGDRVSVSTIVATVGPKYLEDGSLNGFTTGPHLHFTLYYNSKRIDPLSINYSK